MLKTLPAWNPLRKPPAGVCPREYCFHWLPTGSRFAPGVHDSLEEAFQQAQPVFTEQCGCTFGHCIRLDPVNGDGDYYEPDEPRLDWNGLPWFYFMSGPEKVVDELRDDYIQEAQALWGATAPGQTVSINGMEMYYEVQGEGYPLLLLHGFTGAGSNWSLVFPEPPDGYQLIIPDLRGHGRSTNPSMEFTHRQSALDVLALMDTLKIERFMAIGMSAGAKTLLHMATKQSDRIDSMVLVSATPYFPEQARAIMRQMTEENRTEEEWLQMRQWHHHGDEQIRMLWRQGNAFKDSYDDMNLTPADLGRITAPTLIVHGDRDPLYPLNIATEMYAAIPNSYLWIVPNGGHGPIFGDMAPRFADIAMSFLGGDWERK
jgi:pimeloyl-ACP methyl ester carboxylesterase